jgi:CRISPR-associated endonuclease/helicase Cas3
MFNPYPYQERVLGTLLKEQQNVILVVPTGGGKTEGALLPYLQDRAWASQDASHVPLLPEKALYAVPTRVLATQFQERCTRLREEVLEPAPFEALEQRYRRFGRGLNAVQTGETPEDPQFESMIVACTIDQLLASALGVPYSLRHSAANINVGAICSSYLILDEPHLYPLAEGKRSYKGALTTCLEMPRLFKGLTRFVFMSATMSGKLVARLSDMLDARVIQLDDDELLQINQGRCRTIERSSAPMSAESIVRAHDRCSLVVCNTVQQAQEMYLELDALLKQRSQRTQLKLLHSRFTDEDRRAQADDLCKLLGKEQWRAGVYQRPDDVIVVATQVIEVGLDISAQVLHTQLAPANSLLQRAGRCARFESQEGRVIVYPLPAREDGKPASTLPYDASLCEKTWEALSQFEGKPMGFREEQDLIDIVHTDDDLDLLQRYEDHRLDLQAAITNCLRTHEREHAAELIRDVTQVQLLIHDNPNEAITTEPWRWQSFSLHPGQLMGRHWQALRARQNEFDLSWMKSAVLSPEARQEEQQDEDNRKLATYIWEPITGEASIPDVLMIALPNQLATYDKELGLVFLDGRLPLSAAWMKRLEAQTYQSVLCERWKSANEGQATDMQCYTQHIGGLADAYHYGVSRELGYVMTRLEQLMGLEAGTIDHAIQLAIATHDLGKLNRAWQRWARAWQQLYMERTNWAAHYQEPASDYFFAKTTYDYRNREQRTWQKDLACSRPHHACESVKAGENLLAHSLGVTDERSPNLPVLRATCYAIAHHHTPVAHEYGATTIDPRAREVIELAIRSVRRQGTWSYDLQLLTLQFDKGDLAPANASTRKEARILTLPNVSSAREELLETWLAFVITRALRLADQRADRYAQMKF